MSKKNYEPSACATHNGKHYTTHHGGAYEDRATKCGRCGEVAVHVTKHAVTSEGYYKCVCFECGQTGTCG